MDGKGCQGIRVLGHGGNVGDGGGGLIILFSLLCMFQVFSQQKFRTSQHGYPCSMSVLTSLSEQRAWDGLHGWGYNPLSTSRGILPWPKAPHPYQPPSLPGQHEPW